MREILFRGRHGKQWVYGNLATNKRGQVFISAGLASAIYAVIPETVGQYTGLTDKNGIKIFEGDIVEFGYGVGKIVWQTDDAMFYIRYEQNNIVNFGSVAGEYCEVIGNIHDTPELIGGANNEDCSDNP